MPSKQVEALKHAQFSLAATMGALNDAAGMGVPVENIMHLSEYAFYRDADTLMQSVPDDPNTTIIVESTANAVSLDKLIQIQILALQQTEGQVFELEQGGGKMPSRQVEALKQAQFSLAAAMAALQDAAEIGVPVENIMHLCREVRKRVEASTRAQEQIEAAK